MMKPRITFREFAAFMYPLVRTELREFMVPGDRLTAIQADANVFSRIGLMGIARPQHIANDAVRAFDELRDRRGAIDVIRVRLAFVPVTGKAIAGMRIGHIMLPGIDIC